MTKQVMIGLRAALGLATVLLLTSCVSLLPRPTYQQTAAEIHKAAVPNVVTILYGTDRQSGGLGHYTGGRAGRLELGEAHVSVPKTHVAGKVELPGYILWTVRAPADPKKHFVITEAPRILSESDFALRAGALSQNGSGLLYIHGYNQSFDTGLYRTAQLAYDFGIKGPVFYYSWPSRGQVVAYDYDVDSAEQATIYLEKYLKVIFAEAKVRRLNIIAHSRGNTLLLRTLHTMYAAGAELPDDCCGQLVLASPDVDSDYAKGVISDIARRFQGVTLYVNDKDKALALSEIKAGGVPRLGQLQRTHWPLILSGMDSIDATAAREGFFELNHDLYVDNSVLLYDMDALIEHGQRPPNNRTPTFRPVTVAQGEYWRLAP